METENRWSPPKVTPSDPCPCEHRGGLNSEVKRASWEGSSLSRGGMWHA